jgi:hypothetical protein
LTSRKNKEVTSYIKSNKMTSKTTLAALVVFSPDSGLCTVFHKNLTSYEVGVWSKKKGTTVKEKELSSWKGPEKDSLFPEDQEPVLWIHVKEDFSDDEDFLASSEEHVSEEESEEAEEVGVEDDVDEDEDENLEEEDEYSEEAEDSEGVEDSEEGS